MDVRAVTGAPPITLSLIEGQERRHIRDQLGEADFKPKRQQAARIADQALCIAFDDPPRLRFDDVGLSTWTNRLHSSAWMCLIDVRELASSQHHDSGKQRAQTTAPASSASPSPRQQAGIRGRRKALQRAAGQGHSDTGQTAPAHRLRRRVDGYRVKSSPGHRRDTRPRHFPQLINNARFFPFNEH